MVYDMEWIVRMMRRDEHVQIVVVDNIAAVSIAVASVAADYYYYLTAMVVVVVVVDHVSSCPSAVAVVAAS